MDIKITKYLRKVLDASAYAHQLSVKSSLPLYLSEKYSFYQGSVLDREVILINEKETNSSINTLKKDIQVIERKYAKPVVIVNNSITEYRTAKYIEESIPFIIINKQIYLPFIATVYEDRIKTHRWKKIKKFNPSTQAIYLYMLYHNKQYSAHNIAEYFMYSLMTVSRAMNDLCNIGLVKYKIKGKTGRLKIYKRIDNPDYYSKGREYLIDPIKFSYYSGYEKEYYQDALIAGESALSELTMINPVDHDVIAVSPMHQMSIQFYEHDERKTEIQIWKYDPSKLSATNIVDVVSLMLTLKDTKDERIESEIKYLLRDNEWYME